MFDLLDFLSLAESLAREDDEACQRSAVSRAYYAVFCTARDWLFGRGFQTTNSGSIHLSVWNEFKFQQTSVIWSVMSQQSVHTAMKLGEDGLRLRRLRNQADYDIDFDEPASQARIAIRRSRSIATAIAELRER